MDPRQFEGRACAHYSSNTSFKLDLSLNWGLLTFTCTGFQILISYRRRKRDLSGFVQIRRAKKPFLVEPTLIMYPTCIASSLIQNNLYPGSEALCGLFTIYIVLHSFIAQIFFYYPLQTNYKIKRMQPIAKNVSMPILLMGKQKSLFAAHIS